MIETHLAIFPAENQPEICRALLQRFLQKEELHALEAVRLPPIRQERFLARAATRQLLVEATGGAPLDWHFTYQKSGKPLAIRADGFKMGVSWAHTRGHVLAVVSQEEVGCDVELRGRHMPAVEDINGVSTDFFRAKEHFESDPALHLWVAREALSKLRGTGVFADLSKLSLEKVQRLSDQSWTVVLTDRGCAEQHTCTLQQTKRFIVGLALGGTTDAAAQHDIREAVLD